MKSTILNSKRVALTVLTLVLYAYIIHHVELKSVISQVVAFVMPGFVTLTTTMGISWSEKAMIAGEKIVKDITEVKSNGS